MTDGRAKSPGSVVAEMLTGSWRPCPPAFEHSEAELEAIAPLLLTSGAAALCWWRIRHCDLRSSQAAEELYRDYRLNRLQTFIQQRTIEQIVSRLRSVGIEPILVKGWAASGAYPEIGLRPCGDIDLCVRPEQIEDAEVALKDLKLERYEVDLHRGFEKFGGGSIDEIYRSSQLIRLEETDVRVPCAEDHLRVLSIHMLREGAWRPLWLCDVAAAVESRPANFDWDSCLGKKRHWSDWVVCALRLAQQLLSADISDTPAAERLKPLPRWLVPTIMKEWGSSQPSMVQRHHAPMASYWRRPLGILTGLRHRWPNPIEATISAGGQFNQLPRLPLQIGSYVARSAKFAARLPKLLREQ